jgi:hypothetical protein
MTGAIFYLVDNGIKWRALPADFPPWKTVYGIRARWKQDGVLADITDLLRARVRMAAGRHPEPSAAIIDSQSRPGCWPAPLAVSSGSSTPGGDGSTSRTPQGSRRTHVPRKTDPGRHCSQPNTKIPDRVKLMRTDFADRRGDSRKCRSRGVESNSDPRNLPATGRHRRQQRRPVPARR